MGKMMALPKLELAILHSLSDDYECPTSIWPWLQEDIPETSWQDMLDALYRLHQAGLIELTDGQSLNRATLMSEVKGDYDTRHWFGLTPSGCAEWEAGSEPPIDWSDSWRVSADSARRRGVVEGTSREVCLAALQRLVSNGKYIKYIIDMTSLTHSEISGFQAKYYKHLQGGHRIDFQIASATTSSIGARQMKHRTSMFLALGCGALTYLAGWISLSGGPSLLSPVNVILLIPAFFFCDYVGSRNADVVAALLPPLAFWAWSWPAFRAPARVPVRSIILLGGAVVLSAISIVAGWPYGLEYQSLGYMIGVTVVNIIAWSALICLAFIGRRRQSYAINIIFHVVLFVWLAWYAAPYAGGGPP